MQGNWSEDVNNVLDKIRVNSITLSNEHKKTYFVLASYIKWFRVPVIFLSAAGSILGMALVPYLSQSVVTVTCSVISMSVGLIGSVELFLGIGNKMESELVQSKELYLLAIELQKTLLLDPLNRNGDGIAYLEDKFNIYSKLIENSYLLESRIIDELTPLPNEFQVVVSRTPSEESNRSWFFRKRRRRRKTRPELGVLDVNRFRNMRKVKPESSPEPSPEEGNTPVSIKIKLNDQPSRNVRKVNSLHSMSPMTHETVNQDPPPTKNQRSSMEGPEYHVRPDRFPGVLRRETVDAPSVEVQIPDSVQDASYQRKKGVDEVTYPGASAYDRQTHGMPSFHSAAVLDRKSFRNTPRSFLRNSLLQSVEKRDEIMRKRASQLVLKDFSKDNVCRDLEPPQEGEDVSSEYGQSIKNAINYVNTKFKNNPNTQRRSVEATPEPDSQPDLEEGGGGEIP